MKKIRKRADSASLSQNETRIGIKKRNCPNLPGKLSAMWIREEPEQKSKTLGGVEKRGTM